MATTNFCVLGLIIAHLGIRESQRMDEAVNTDTSVCYVLNIQRILSS